MLDCDINRPIAGQMRQRSQQQQQQPNECPSSGKGGLTEPEAAPAQSETIESGAIDSQPPPVCGSIDVTPPPPPRAATDTPLNHDRHDHEAKESQLAAAAAAAPATKESLAAHDTRASGTSCKAASALKIEPNHSVCDHMKPNDQQQQQQQQQQRANMNSLLDSIRMEPPRQRIVPKRKLSVFSHNGFPNIQLLDKETLKSRSLSVSSAGIEQQQQLQQQQQQQQQPGVIVANVQALVPELIRPSVDKSSAVVVKSEHHQDAEQQQQSSRRPIRSDTLGSTGSSRASSCDEPAMLALNQYQPQQQQQPQQQRQHLSSGNGACERRKLTPPGSQSSASTTCMNSASSSTSSLDCWPRSDTAVEQQQPRLTAATLATNSSAERLARTSTTSASVAPPPPLPPPFESIKAQLTEQNSIPSAQSIQQHIDKLICQNEAIMENWNSVSIRSYNSSRDCNGGATSSKRSTVSGTSSAGPNPSTRQATRMPSKRWSTAMLLGRPSSNYNCRLSDNCATNLLRSSATTAAATATTTTSPTTCDNSSNSSNDEPINRTTTTGNNNNNENSPSAVGQRHQQLLLKERKRSYDMMRSSSSALTADNSPSSLSSSSSLMNNPSRPIAINNRQPAAPAGQARISSAGGIYSSAPTSPRSAASLAALSGFERLALSKQRQDPNYLETAIQNLSLRRGDIGSSEQQQSLRHDSGASDHLTANGNSLGHQIYHHHQQHHQQQQQQQQREEEQQQQQRAMIMAAILLERQNQCMLTEQQALSLESQAAVLRQQEHLRFTQQLAAAAALHQYPYHDLLASVPTLMAFQQQQQGVFSPPSQAQLDSQQVSQQQQQQQQLANKLLRPCEEPSHSRLMAHGAEMLTHSLDGATPSYRCDACDIPFWTRDLLSYHLLTQCAGRRASQTQQQAHLSPSQSVAAAAAGVASFNFYGPNNYDQPHSNQQQQQQQLSKSVSPPRAAVQRQLEFNQCDHRPHHHHQQHLAAASASDAGLAYSNYNPANWLIHPDDERAIEMGADAESILKQQLLAAGGDTSLLMSAAAAAAGLVYSSPTTCSQREAQLPLKKRKISEPNMKY